MFDTIIIGAGISGLAAGHHLIEEKKTNFLVLEWANHVGGRCQTVEFGGRLFSKGPGWVHGKHGNPIFKLLTKLKVPMESARTVGKDLFYVWDTEKKKDVTNDFCESWKKILNLELKVSEKYKKIEIDPNKSLYDLLAENSTFFDSMTDLDRTVIYAYLENFFGTSIKKVSAMSEIQHDKIYEEDEEINDFRILDPLGEKEMIDFLCKDFRDKIKLNSKVTTIETHKNLNKVEVSLENGQKYFCKNVIITVQSNLLANDAITFKPKLPNEKYEAWKYIPVVNYCRIFAKFPTKFWPEREWFIPVIKDVNPTQELLCWQNCELQDLCSEEDNILICHYSGDLTSSNLRFDVKKDQLIEIVADSIKKIFPDNYCKPNDVLFVTFLGNERFAGAYSQTSPGFTSTHLETLIKSVGPLHFAGESVLVDFIGTMQAAYKSGIIAAKKTLI